MPTGQLPPQKRQPTGVFNDRMVPTMTKQLQKIQLKLTEEPWSSRRWNGPSVVVWQVQGSPEVLDPPEPQLFSISVCSFGLLSLCLHNHEATSPADVEEEQEREAFTRMI